jgi:hypothetical protein
MGWAWFAGRMTTNEQAWTPFNVIASFPPGTGGAAAVDALAVLGVPPSAVTLHQPADGPTREEVAELEAEMQDELVESFGSLTGPQARRAFAAAAAFGAAGIVLGTVVGLGWAYLLASGLSRLSRLVIMAGVFGLAGATVGFIDAGSGLNPRHPGEAGDDEEPLAAERDVLVTVHLADPAPAERVAEVLGQLGAERVHFFDGHGIPLPPQARHPRPADPDDWWWRAAGRG